MSEFLKTNGQPDWELIREQMCLYGAKDGLKAKEVKREVSTELGKMKQEWRETGQIKGWIEQEEKGRQVYAGNLEDEKKAKVFATKYEAALKELKQTYPVK